MNSTKNKYTKEQFVKEFLARQAATKAIRSVKKEAVEAFGATSTSFVKEADSSVSEGFDIEVPVKSTSKRRKDDTVVERKNTNQIIDLTNTKEICETKVITENQTNVIELNALNKPVENLDKDKTINSIEDIKTAIREEENFFNSNKNVVFEVEINYSSSDLSFNGLNLLEEKLRDGNLQVGFDVNTGTFVGDTIKKIVRKRKAKVESEDLYVQISFE